MQSGHAFPDIPAALYTSHHNILPFHHGSRAPLWGTINNETEYFEVNVLEDKRVDEDFLPDKDIEKLLNLNQYTCHICDIQVPTTYVKEHNSSQKHKTCSEIANIALERTKRQIQLEISTPKLKIQDTYFCETCCLVVLNSQKETHDTTKSHAVSVKHNELLKDFLKIYENIENVEVNSDINKLELLKQNIEDELFVEESLGSGLSDIVESFRKALMDYLNNDKKDCVIMKMITELCNKTLKKHAEEQFRTNYEKTWFKIVEFLEQKFKSENISKDNNITISFGLNYQYSNSSEPLVLYENDTNNSSLKNIYTQKKVWFQPSLPANDKQSVDIVASNNDVTNTGVVESFENDTNKNTSVIPLHNETSKINAVMTKYFDKSCTVDALKLCNNNENPKKSVEKVRYQNIEAVNNGTEHNSSFLHKTTEENNNSNVIHNLNLNTVRNDNQKFDKKEEQDITSLDELGESKQNKKNPKRKKGKKSNKQILKKDKLFKAQPVMLPNNVVEEEVDSKSLGYNLVYYLRDITSRWEPEPIHTVKALTDIIVQIKAINGDKFKIHVNNFHSFHMKSNDIFCKICERPNVSRPESHINENDHKSKVMIAIHNLNGIRQLDDIWNHCIHCNDLINNTEFHVQSLRHKNKVQQSLIKLGNKDNQNKGNLTNKSSNDAERFAELLSKNNLVLTSKNYLNCNICDVIVHYELTVVQQHVNSIAHLNNFDLRRDQNKMVFSINPQTLYCIPCDRHLAKKAFVSHYTGKKHANFLKEFLIKQRELPSEAQEDVIVLTSISQIVKKSPKDKVGVSVLICFVCNSTIYSTEGHMNSFDHKKSYLEYLETNKLKETAPDSFLCIACNIVIGIDCLMIHCVGRIHKLILKNFQSYGPCHRSKYCTMEECSKQYINAQCINNERSKTEDDCYLSNSQTNSLSATEDKKTKVLKVLYQLKKSKPSVNFICTACDEEIPRNFKLASYHVGTVDHVLAFNLTMVWNKIKKRDDKYFCDICMADIKYFSEIDHVLSEVHAKNLAKQPKGTVYEYDRTLLTHAYAMSRNTVNIIGLEYLTQFLEM